jgi:hypothetical protein
MVPTRDEVFAEFEADGEPLVRKRLITEHYGPPGAYRRGFAEEWLRLREEARRDASNLEQLEVARSAKNAAWAAAIAAILAAICAVIAVVQTI